VGAEPAVEGDFLTAVVAVEDAVVKVVKVGAGGKCLFGKGFLEAVMASGRAKRASVFAVEKEMDGMGGDNEIDEDAAEIEKMLNGVH